MAINRFRKFIPAKGFAKSLSGAIVEQKQECCVDCDFPVQENFAFPPGEQGVPYEYEYTLNGTAPFDFIVVSKPSWMTVTLNGNVLSFTGTPTGPGNETVAFTISACGRNVNLDGQFVVFQIDLGELASMVNFADEPTGAYEVGVFNVDQEYVGTANDPDEFIALWNADPANAALGQLETTGNPFEFVFIPLNGAPTPTIYGLPYIEYPLLNFDDNPVPSAPYGLFRTNETLISIASGAADAVTAWNGETAFSDVAFAVPVTGSDVSIGLFLKNSDPVPDMKALRYWTLNALSGTPTVYLSGDTYVRRGNGVLVKSNTGTANVYTSFGMNANTYGTGGSIPLVDTTSPNFGVTLTTGTNYFFHNETGEWAWVDVFAVVGFNTGYLPPTVRHLAIQSFGQNGVANNLSLENFANFPAAVSNVEAISFNGTVINYEGAWINSMPNLETWQLITTGGSPTNLKELATLNLSATSTPNLKWIGYRRNNTGAALAQNDSFWANLPAMTKGVDLVGAQLEPAANVDGAFNALGVSQAATVTEANARLTIQLQNANRTSASDAAVAILTARPYVIG